MREAKRKAKEEKQKEREEERKREEAKKEEARKEEARKKELQVAEQLQPCQQLLLGFLPEGRPDGVVGLRDATNGALEIRVSRVKHIGSYAIGRGLLRAATSPPTS